MITSDKGGEKNEIEVKTVESLSENIQELVSLESSYENVYCEIPDVKLEHIIAKNSDVHDHIEEHHENETQKIKRKQYS